MASEVSSGEQSERAPTRQTDSERPHETPERQAADRPQDGGEQDRTDTGRPPTDEQRQAEFAKWERQQTENLGQTPEQRDANSTREEGERNGTEHANGDTGRPLTDEERQAEFAQWERQQTENPGQSPEQRDANPNRDQGERNATEHANGDTGRPLTDEERQAEFAQWERQQTENLSQSPEQRGANPNRDQGERNATEHANGDTGRPLTDEERQAEFAKWEKEQTENRNQPADKAGTDPRRNETERNGTDQERGLDQPGAERRPDTPRDASPDAQADAERARPNGETQEHSPEASREPGEAQTQDNHADKERPNADAPAQDEKHEAEPGSSSKLLKSEVSFTENGTDRIEADQRQREQAEAGRESGVQGGAQESPNQARNRHGEQEHRDENEAGSEEKREAHTQGSAREAAEQNRHRQEHGDLEHPEHEQEGRQTDGQDRPADKRAEDTEAARAQSDTEREQVQREQDEQGRPDADRAREQSQQEHGAEASPDRATDGAQQRQAAEQQRQNDGIQRETDAKATEQQAEQARQSAEQTSEQVRAQAADSNDARAQAQADAANQHAREAAEQTNAQTADDKNQKPEEIAARQAEAKAEAERAEAEAAAARSNAELAAQQPIEPPTAEKCATYMTDADARQAAIRAAEAEERQKAEAREQQQQQQQRASESERQHEQQETLRRQREQEQHEVAQARNSEVQQQTETNQAQAEQQRRDATHERQPAQEAHENGRKSPDEAHQRPENDAEKNKPAEKQEAERKELPPPPPDTRPEWVQSVSQGLREFNDILGHGPGGPEGLQNFAKIVQDYDNDLKKEFDMTKPHTGLRYILAAIENEPEALGKFAKMGGEQATAAISSAFAKKAAHDMEEQGAKQVAKMAQANRAALEHVGPPPLTTDIPRVGGSPHAPMEHPPQPLSRPLESQPRPGSFQQDKAAREALVEHGQPPLTTDAPRTPTGREPIDHPPPPLGPEKSGTERQLDAMRLQAEERLRQHPEMANQMPPPPNEFQKQARPPELRPEADGDVRRVQEQLEKAHTEHLDRCHDVSVRLREIQQRKNELSSALKGESDLLRREAIYQEALALKPQYAAALHEAAQLEPQRLEKAREALRLPENERINLSIDNPANFNLPNSREIQEGIDTFRGYTSNKMDLGQHVYLVTDGLGGSNANKVLNNVVSMALDETKATTAAHELAHILEFNHPEVLQESINFLSRRTQGSLPLTRMNWNQTATMLPDNKGKFVDYVGRVYTNERGRIYATEVLSMGIERLHLDPVKFAREDPEYFAHVIKCLRGLYKK